jgi:hypothetical protein
MNSDSSARRGERDLPDNPAEHVNRISIDCPDCGWSSTFDVEEFSTTVRCPGAGCGAKLMLTAAVDTMEVLHER